MSHYLWVRTDNTAISSHFRLLVLDIRQWSLLGDGIFVCENKYVIVLAEKSVYIFECAVGCFRVEKVYNGHERGIENSPNDVEFPVERLDT